MSRRAAFATLALAVCLSPALAGDPAGPPMGSTKYTTSIQPTDPGETDTDDYVAFIGMGETLSVTVVVSKRSTLEPSLVVIGPDGTQYTEASGDILVKAKGRKLTLTRGFLVPMTGRWAARVGGKNDTVGEYKAIFKVKKAKPQKEKKLTLGGAGPLTADHAFEAVDGGILTLTLTSKKGGETATLRKLADPSGADAPEPSSPDGTAAAAATLKGRKVQLKKQELHQGDGTYVATVGIDGTAQGDATYNLVLKVLPPPRAKTRGVQRLDPTEPRLDALASPVRSIEGEEVFFDGRNFVAGPDTRVFIGSARAQVISATSTRVTVTVPAGTDGATVAVTVQNPDGQAAVLDDAFTYVPPPVINNLLDAQGNPQRGGAVAGLGAYTVVGDHFEAGLTVRFGTEEATVLAIPGLTEIDIETPPGPGGVSSFVNIFVVDRFGREAQSAFLFEYKFAPRFDPDPYAPRLGPADGNALITVSGQNFEITDTLSIDGQILNKQFLSATSLRFFSPALTPGSYALTITDKYRVAVVGPDFQVKAAPTITNLVDDAGDPVRTAHSTGGNTLRLLGTDFTPQDTVRIGTDPVAALTFSSSTELSIELPNTQQAGDVSITVEDEAEQVATSGFQITLKRAPAFDADAFTPPFSKTGGNTVITVSGSDFEDTDVFRIDGTVVGTTFVDSGSFTFTAPTNLADGTYATSVEDRLNLQIPGPALEFKGPPTMSGVTVVSGGELSTGEISRHGGATLRVAGSRFRSDDDVELGGKTVTTSNVGATTFDLVAEAFSALGSHDLLVTDQVQQSATLGNAVDVAGFDDNTANRFAAGSSTDDFSALRGVIGDLDDDGEDDDLVIVSNSLSAPGSRYEYTRILIESNGKLVDRTGANFPGYGTDYLAVDYWTANAVALGDLDGDGATDIVIADKAPLYPYSGYYYYHRSYNGVRMFTNDGYGAFSLDESFGAELIPYEYYTDEYGSTGGYLFTSYIPYLGVPTPRALAIGDLDGDGNEDVVVGMDSYSAANWYSYPYYGDPTYYVTFGATADSHYMNSGYYNYYGYYYYYGPATHILINETDLTSGAFRDATFERVPIPGTYGTYAAAFPASDLTLGDIDKDNDLDIVVAWYDPYSTSPYGLFAKNGTSGVTVTNTDVSTRVLLNDGQGFFSDGTGQWMPAGSSPEFFQAHRVKLADLDKDGDLDMVLLLEESTDAFQGMPSFNAHALRILRNDGSVTGFTNVTTTVLPALPTNSDDNFRGTALAVADVDGDGNLDILVGATEALQDDDGNDIRRTRLLLGASNTIKFTDGSNFLPPVDDDSGEANQILLGDIVTGGELELILLTEIPPTDSANDEFARVFDWTE